MQISRNQYVTFTGILPKWLPALHEVMADPKVNGTGGKPPAIMLRDVKLMRHHGIYTVELECPLEYSDSGGKKVYHPDGQAFRLVHAALGGLYPKKEMVVTDIGSNTTIFLVEQTVKITGVSPVQLSHLFNVCTSHSSKSRYHQCLGNNTSTFAVEEIVFLHMVGAEWNSDYKTFTVTVRLLPVQHFDGTPRHLLSGGRGGWEEQNGTLYAPESVLSGMYSTLNGYYSIRDAYMEEYYYD